MASVATEFDSKALAKVGRRYGIRRMWLFGSAARGDMRDDSDVDVLVEFKPGEPGRGWDYFGVGPDLEPIFGGRKVDVADISALYASVGRRIQCDMQLIFEDEEARVDEEDGSGEGSKRPNGGVTPEERDDLRLCHVLRAAEELRLLSAGVDKAAFSANTEKRMAWAHLIQIIGEAAGKLGVETRERIPSVPWPKTVGMRHRIVHDYFNIKDDIVYRIATTEMQPLIEGVSTFLRDRGVDCDEMQQPWKP